MGLSNEETFPIGSQFVALSREFSILILSTLVVAASACWMMRSKEKKSGVGCSSKNIPDIPPVVILGNILPFLSDRITWNNLCSCNKELYRYSRKARPPWPRRIILPVGSHLDSSTENFAITCATFSPAGDKLAIGMRTSICVFNQKNGSITWLDTADTTVVRPHEKNKHLAFSRDGELLAASGWSDAVQLWRIQIKSTMELEQKEPADCAPASLLFHPDGTMVAASFDCGIVRVWKVLDGTSVQDFRSGYEKPSISFSPDGASLVAGWKSVGGMALWNLGSGGNLLTRARLEIHNALPVWSLAHSPDGQCLAAACTDGCVRLWNLPNQTLVATLANDCTPGVMDNGSIMPFRCHDVLDLPRGGWAVVSFSRDSKRLVLSSQRNFRVWNLKRANGCLRAVPSDRRPSFKAGSLVGVSPCGSVAACITSVFNLVNCQSQTLRFKIELYKSA